MLILCTLQQLYNCCHSECKWLIRKNNEHEDEKMHNPQFMPA